MRWIDKARLNKAVKLTVFFILAYLLIREYLPYPHDPRIDPGTNVIDLYPGTTAKVFGHDFSVRVLQAGREGLDWWPFSRWPVLHQSVADWKVARHTTRFEVFRADGTCRAFKASGGETVFFDRPDSALITFKGTFRNRVRLEFQDFPTVYDSDFSLNLNQSEQVPTTDVVLTVISITRPPNLGAGPEGSGPAASPPTTVTFSAHHLRLSAGGTGGESKGAEPHPVVFSDQLEGAVVRFDNRYDIFVKSVFPSEVRFAVRAAAKHPGYPTGEPCPERR